jgi:DNA-directed RNA polymerase subunit RPC12/RpoP
VATVESEFTCERCGHTFTKGRPDQEAHQEYEDLFPESRARGDETVLLCDDCWREFMAWTKANGIRL